MLKSDMPVRRRARRTRTRSPAAPSVESAARSLWKDLADERRRGLIQSLVVQDDCLVLSFVKEPIVVPKTWHGYLVRQEKYRKPASELELRARGAVTGLLGLAEKDPERFLRLAEGAVSAAQDTAKFAKENPGEVKRFLINNVITGFAKGLKKQLEK